MKLLPLGDRVFIKQIDEPQTTLGGIFLPESVAKDAPQWGIVEQVGPGKTLENGSVRPMHVKVGDKVLFGKYSGSKIKVGNTDMLFMHEEDVIAIAG